MLKPLGNRVIIQKSEQEQTTKGAGRILKDGSRVAPEVNEGDKVVFQQYAGTEVKRGDETYLIVNEEDILAIIES